LYQLSDSDDPATLDHSRSLNSPVNDTRNRRAGPRSHSRKEETAFDEAFAPTGIRRLPKPDGRPTENKKLDSTSAGTAANIQEDLTLKTAILATNYVEINPAETVLLRQLPFTLQGLSSTSLNFSSQSGLKLPQTLPAPIISLLYSLAEPSLLYKGLEAFVHSSELGLLGQSLRAAIGGELRSYLNLVAALEGQIRQTLTQLDEETPRIAIGQAGVTLKRMVVWTREATMGLRLLSLIAEESKSQSSSPILRTTLTCGR